MPFIPTTSRLTVEQRQSIWATGFPLFSLNGFEVYFGKAKPGNICNLCRDSDWWKQTAVYVPSDLVRHWIELNYPDFEEDMRNLANFLFMKRDDYFSCADYITTLYQEKSLEIRSLVAGEYMYQYLSQPYRFPTVSQSSAEQVGIWLMDAASWSKNIPIQMLENGIENDVDDFWKELPFHIDEFLGGAVRSCGFNFVSESVDENVESDRYLELLADLHYRV